MEGMKTNEELLSAYIQEEHPEKKAQLLDDFTRDNFRFIGYIAYKKMGSIQELSEDERMSAASFGFVKAAKSFDPEKGIKFVTYAARCMTNQVLMELRTKGRRERYGVARLQDVIRVDESRSDVTLEDTISSSEVIGEDFEDHEILQQAWDIINKTLTAREIAILNAYLHEDTQTDTATRFAISQSYISRLQARVLKKIENIGTLLQSDRPIPTGSKHEKIFNKKELANLKKPKNSNYGKTAGMVKFLVETYPSIQPAQIARIIGSNPQTIKQYTHKLRKGLLADITPIPVDISHSIFKEELEDLPNRKPVPTVEEFKDTIAHIQHEHANTVALVAASIEQEEATEFQEAWENAQATDTVMMLPLSSEEDDYLASSVSYQVQGAQIDEVQLLIDMVRKRVAPGALYDFSIDLRKIK